MTQKDVDKVEVSQIVDRLKDLSKDRRSFFNKDRDGDDKIFREDYATLCRAVELLESLYVPSQSPLQFDPNREIAITWNVDDVKHIRPDLTDEQAMDVLHEVKDHHDATCGVSWTTLRTSAEILFPKFSDD